MFGMTTNNGKLTKTGENPGPLPVVTQRTNYRHASNTVLLYSSWMCKDVRTAVDGLYSTDSTNCMFTKRHYKIPSLFTETQEPHTFNNRKPCNFCNSTVNLHEKSIVCHMIAVHNLNKNHSRRPRTPITALSVHQVHSCSTCVQQNTDFINTTHYSPIQWWTHHNTTENYRSVGCQTALLT
jgi:hypothetical protein